MGPGKKQQQHIIVWLCMFDGDTVGKKGKKRGGGDEGCGLVGIILSLRQQQNASMDKEVYVYMYACMCTGYARGGQNLSVGA
jgi:hypothetical protein